MEPLAIVASTASGKSALAMALARTRGDVELVSVDSMQVYRGMDIGTAKPTADDRDEIRHHVLDLVEPTEAFDVRTFQAAVADALAGIARRRRHAVLVGGTGLYLRAVVDGLDLPGRFPAIAAELEAVADTPKTTVGLHRRLSELDPWASERMEPTNRRRVIRALEVTLGSGRRFSSYGPGLSAYPQTPVRLIGVRLAPPVVAERIEVRYRRQLADGFLDEVRRLAAGPPLSRTAAQALGYRELLAYVQRVPLDRTASPRAPTLAEALDVAMQRTRRFAKRQRAWFGRDPRITWLDPVDEEPLTVLAELQAAAAGLWD